MARGGRRPGAGRGPGQLNKRTIEAIKFMGPVGDAGTVKAGLRWPHVASFPGRALIDLSTAAHSLWSG
jgi:hypothetical protein